MLLLCATVLAEAGQQAPAANRRVPHSCSVTDRQFVQVARLDVESVDSLAQDYLDGRAKAADVASAAQDAAAWAADTEPTDPSLGIARRYLRAMFLEYAKAVRIRAAHGDAAQTMYRAYDMEEQVHDTLQPARATLARLGCDVGELL
ncbi:MAG TPA: hypothetical protein VFA05_05775 [Gaiellaceae bacterium]|nr:hypothetical protein [Gaiellaceae bacterium]